MWWMATVALGGPIEADEALKLGPPLMHDIDLEAGVLRLEWKDDNGKGLVHEIALEDIHDVRRIPDPEGPHLLVVTTDTGGFVLERGPCLLMAAMAPKLAEALARPLVDGPACADTTAESRAWMDEQDPPTVFTHVDQWNGAVLADVRVTERSTGEPALDVQRGLIAARPLLGHCFSSQQVTGGATFDATARTNGSLGHVNPVAPGTGVRVVDGCIAEQLDGADLREAPERKRKVHIEVSTP